MSSIRVFLTGWPSGSLVTMPSTVARALAASCLGRSWASTLAPRNRLNRSADTSFIGSVGELGAMVQATAAAASKAILSCVAPEAKEMERRFGNGQFTRYRHL